MLISRAALLLTALGCLTAVCAAGVPWSEVRALKLSQLRKAAEHAVAQQRTESMPPQPLEAEYSGVGGVAAERVDDWDADGDGSSVRVTLANIPEYYQHTDIADRLQVRFPQPVNLIEKSTGLAFWIRADQKLSKDVRFGLYFKVRGTDQDPVVISDIPVHQKFGDNPHLVYIDWGYVFDHTVGVFKVPPKDFFTRVEGFDLTFVQKRLPREDVKLEPASGTFHLDGLALVDFYDGSYDSDRFPKGGPMNAKQPIISQGRTQQVARICAEFGGDQGARSAIRAMDMMARIQCWDGSWPEMQTRLEGEWTHGMILADLSWTLAALRKQNRPELKDVVEIRQWKMPRDALYEQMIYRGARSRSPAPISSFRDTYTSGKGALEGGCNRPMVYTYSQYVAAQVMTDPRRRKEIMAEYDANVDDVAAHQGVTAGGWPIFGEGNRYEGRGLHWDVGYTTDHVFIMAMASRATGDKRWGDMMKKFDTVVEAMVLPNGYQIDGALSERGRGRSGGLKAPDLVYQEAMRWGARRLAQWAANASEQAWREWPRGGSMWSYVGTARGYGLGAFLTWNVFDLQEEPEPKDLGHIFPRQWALWSARWIGKDHKEVRRSKIIVGPGAKMASTFKWEVGQYPVVTGIPLAVEVAGDVAVEIEPVAYRGDVARLPAAPKLSLIIEEDRKARTADADLKADRFTLELSGPARVRMKFAEDEDTEIEFLATPQKPGPATLQCRLLRKPEPYEHTYAADNGKRDD